jgi:hypothetical protein
MGGRGIADLFSGRLELRNICSRKSQNMARQASIVHNIPGRMRIRIPSAKDDPSFLEQARAALAALPNVVEVTSNPVTGSLLVLYSPASQRDFEGALKMSNGSPLPFDLHKAADSQPARKRKSREHQKSEFAQMITDMFKGLDDAIREGTDNLLDLKTLVPLALAGLGFRYVRTGERTPVWLTFMIFAFTSFTALQPGGTGAGTDLENEMMADEVLG